MEDKKKRNQIIKISVFITSIFVILLSVSYAFINLTLQGEKKQVIKAGNLSLELKEDENAINISDALPMYDEVGMLQEAFTFRIINNTGTTTLYTLKLIDITTGDKLDTGIVKYGLTKDGVTTKALLSTLTDEVIDSGTIGADTIEYELRLWIDSSVTDNTIIKDKSLSYRLELTTEQVTTESTSCPVLAEVEPNTPELTSGMIAVTYNESEKTWVKADSTTSDWYDYKNQIWANAVTVTEETRDSYKTLAVGEPISMDDINTMWVWIPRYSYTIMQPYGRSDTKCSELGEITISSPASCRKVEYPDELRAEVLNFCKGNNSTIATESDCVESTGGEFATFEEIIDYFISYGMVEDTRILAETYPDNIMTSATLPGEIDIKFINESQKDTGTGRCENCAENWVTPEGFSFGNENIPGFWMAKFEVSTLETCSPSANSVNTECDLLTLTPQVKPNVTSWRGARVSTFFEASRLMQSADDNLTYNADTYGFDPVGIGTMDVHMLKNTEWGIVAMLSQSKYGKYGNDDYVGVDKEVAINNCSEFITGIGGDSVSAEESTTTCTTNTYETVKGQTASTTGNIYGIYDMSGGNYESVMGNYNNISGGSVSSNSGFCGTNGPTDGTCREWPDAKYYDLYTSANGSSAYKLGDATYETKNWYNDVYIFDEPKWFIRGSHYVATTSGGLFGSYFMNNGNAYDTRGTRFVIKP